MPRRAAPCQARASMPPTGPFAADPPPVADLRGLDRAAGLVFAVLLALAALVVLDSAQNGDDFETAPHTAEVVAAR
ncbi:hypothetical protein AL036_19910 [Salipiger aestuarii]|nr:hypothetical protein C357_05418 [Citreicella sp. 357]KAA8605264.1 hypothetical protein AL036_19910 [Salipiger aestuarii]KAA8607444.1 hypothetical protein AL037_18790 [Salipiger aestuarii]KAB2537416.1 hypothetical protein AL035_19505 [Salipiger aestuarii]